MLMVPVAAETHLPMNVFWQYKTSPIFTEIE